MKLPLPVLAFAFAHFAIATINLSAQLAELISNLASVGVSNLNGAAIQQLAELESKGGELNNCQIAVRTVSKAQVLEEFDFMSLMRMRAVLYPLNLDPLQCFAFQLANLHTNTLLVSTTTSRHARMSSGRLLSARNLHHAPDLQTHVLSLCRKIRGTCCVRRRIQYSRRDID
jgi:hypothetical protein